MDHIIQFTKASGAGNDFVVIDNMSNMLDLDKARLAVALCSRAFGVGADGLLLLEPSTRADFFMRYYNADGSYGGMCGNGGRCAARYAFLNGLVAATMTFEALDHIYAAEMSGENVRLTMKDPSTIAANVNIALARRTLLGHVVNTGSPHVVIFEQSMDSVDVVSIGKEVRNHEMFRPEGTNVDFVRVSQDGTVRLRTYERGVEAETLACGTGAVASAIVVAAAQGLRSPVRLHVQSGEELRVHFQREGGSFRQVILEGSAHFPFSGTLLYDSIRGIVRSITQPSAVPQQSPID